MGWAQFTACVTAKSGQDISMMKDLGEEGFKFVVEVWNELGPASQAFIELGGEAAGAFIAVLFGEEIAAALLAVGSTIVMGLIIDGIGSCLGTYASG